MWRLYVAKKFVSSTDYKIGSDFSIPTKFDDARHTAMRIRRVHVKSGCDTAVVNVVVPGNIGFSRLERGAVVDVMTETGSKHQLRQVVIHPDFASCVRKNRRGLR